MEVAKKRWESRVRVVFVCAGPLSIMPSNDPTTGISAWV